MQSTGDSFLSEDLRSIDGSPVRSSISLFVTLSIQVILMIERRCRITKACSFFTCRLYIVQASAPYRRVDSTIAWYILPLTRMDTWWLFQSLRRSRPKDALPLAILLCVLSSMHPLLDIVLPMYVNSRTELSLFPSTMISLFRVLVELGWYSTSVFLMLIFRLNFFDASEKSSIIFCISSAECATSALSSANSSSLISIGVVLVFGLKCATLNRSAFCLDCI